MSLEGQGGAGRDLKGVGPLDEGPGEADVGLRPAAVQGHRLPYHCRRGADGKSQPALRGCQRGAAVGRPKGALELVW